MIGIAERHRDKDESARRQKGETVASECHGIEDVLQQVAAQERVRFERTQPAYLSSIGQIGPYVDTRQLTHIDVNDFNPTGSQRAKYLGIDPRLHGFSHRGGTAAEGECRRQPLRRKHVERAAGPTGLGFEHCGLDRPPGKRHDAPSGIASEERSVSPATGAILNTGIAIGSQLTGCGNTEPEPPPNLVYEVAVCRSKPFADG